MVKREGGLSFVPIDFGHGAIKEGEIVEVKRVSIRNVMFHRKYFALIKLAFDYFEPIPVEIKGREVLPLKNFEEFRKWMIVKAGFYDVIGYPDGSVRIRAKSQSFASMSEGEFENLYSLTIDVVLKEIFQDQERKELEAMVMEVMKFS
jgi:hypothetical protein